MTTPLDPADWLLNYDPALHDGNRITPLIDGETYFTELADQLFSLDAGDFFYCAAWVLDPDVLLSPDHTLRDAIDAAAGVGVKIRFLLYKAMQDEPYDEYRFPGRAPPSTLEFVNTMDLFWHGAIEVIIDLRHPLPEGSHHAKYVVVVRRDPAAGDYVVTGYVGGMDIAAQRLATPEHDTWSSPSDWFGSWHDVQCKVEGPIARELLEHFEGRWAQHPTETVWVDALPVKTETTLAVASALPIRQTPVGTVAAQHLFTYPCHPKNVPSGRTQTEYEADAYYAFVPRGMRTIEEAIYNAIRRARVYVYFENYAFYHPGIAAELAARLDAQPDLQVIYCGDYGTFPTYKPATLDAFEIVRASANGANFQAFDLRPPGQLYTAADPEFPDDHYPFWIYPHAKLVIVDDCWATVGSANFNERSMTTDHETNIGFVDLDPANPLDLESDMRVSAGVRAFRRALWSEHLQLDPDDARLESMLTALATWNELAHDVPVHLDAAGASRVFRQNTDLRRWTYWSHTSFYPLGWSYIDPVTPAAQ